MSPFSLLLLLILIPASALAAPLWTYNGTRGSQEYWSELSPDYELCRTGVNQSPVNLARTTNAKLPFLYPEYHATDVSLSLDRWTVVVTPKETISWKEEGSTAHLKELLLRSPSEHLIGAEFYPVELQFVHDRSDQRRMIVSVFVKEGVENKALQSILDVYPAILGSTTNTRLDWNGLLPRKLGYYSYKGSLSYPPCSEGVEMRVLKMPIEASRDQLNQLIGLLGRNAREIQPTYMRTIYESED